MANFKYSGPLTGLTTSKGCSILFPGATVDLPANDPIVGDLVECKRLTEIPDEPVPTRASRKGAPLDPVPTPGGE